MHASKFTEGPSKVASAPEQASGLRAIGQSIYGRILITRLGFLGWRSQEELVALALHLEHEVYPTLRELQVAWIEIEVPDCDISDLASTTEGVTETLPGTERLHKRLHDSGVKKLRLGTKLESGQIVECILLLLFSARAYNEGVAPIPGYGGWNPARIASAMQSPDGYHKFCAHMYYDSHSGVFESNYTYCELGVTRALAKYVRRNKRFGDHRVLFYAAPRYAILTTVLFALPLALYFLQPTLFLVTYLLLIIAVGIASAVAIYTLGAYEYGREHKDMLLKSHMDRVRHMNREIEAQNTLLEKTSALKDLLLQVGAHDIRNPLQQIMLRAESKLNKTAEAEDSNTRTWRTIYLNADRIRGIVDNFLSLQRIQQGKLHTECRPFEIQGLLPAILASRQVEMEHRGMTIATHVENGLPMAVGDHGCVKEVLQNYVGNAIKFGPEGSVITIRCYAREETIRVEVVDTGPGIPMAERDRLFQEFAEISTPSLNGEMSTGLGLAIARKLMECQGGRVGADFPERGGAVFWLEIPDAKPKRGALSPDSVSEDA